MKSNQTVHHAVVDIDVGPRDLQQCADAVIRLRAEYLFAGQCRDEISFKFTSGDTASWKDWRDGTRPSVTGNRVTWRRSAESDASRANFRRYLDSVFTYAGSISLSGELARVENPAAVEIGDVFIQGGSPGHAVIVVDVAQNRSGERVFLLAQSYMPAQDIHILNSADDVNPWYRARSSGALKTPEWIFSFGDSKRFRPSTCEAPHAQSQPAPSFKADAYVVPMLIWVKTKAGRPERGLTIADFSITVDGKPRPLVDVKEDADRPGYYHLNFQPPDADRDGKKHRIEIKVTGHPTMRRSITLPRPANPER